MNDEEKVWQVNLTLKRNINGVRVAIETLLLQDCMPIIANSLEKKIVTLFLIVHYKIKILVIVEVLCRHKRNYNLD